MFDLSGTFDKITELYESDMEDIKRERYETQISHAIELLEKLR